MKAVLMSIKPRWCELIASGKKTVEVRKTKPKLEVPFKVYIYESKAVDKSRLVVYVDGNEPCQYYRGQGRVIGEFVCDSIHEIGWYLTPDHPAWKDGYDAESCLTDRETFEYSKGGTFYQWHISDLVIYDEPRELGEFCTIKKCRSCDSGYESSACIYDEDCRVPQVITRPPQSWCYVERSEG